MEPALGVRVVRGPDWEWGDQDGGDGYVGTVAVLEEGGDQVIIQWDMGKRCRYRCGEDGKFDLRVLDSGQTGIKHQFVQCQWCSSEIWGLLWKCVKCFEYSLCSQCYMAGHHSSLHHFLRVDSEVGGARVKVTPRASAKSGTVTGVFAGAVVVRGQDWRWSDQDGGAGHLGDVLGIKEWKEETVRSTVEVKWKTTNAKRIYRLGHKGKVDVKCVTPSSGGVYYPDHLPVLGDEPVSTEGWAAGDQVKVSLDPDLWKRMQEGHGGWNDRMAEFIGTTGTIQHISDSGVLLVSYPGNAIFHIYPGAVSKAHCPVFRVSDVVCVMDDRGEVAKMQKGHGEWAEDMALSLGQLGRVVKVLPSGDVLVVVTGRRWVFSPACLKPAPGETPQNDTNESYLNPVVKAQVESLIEQSSTDVVVVASAAGDVSTIRSFLKSNPKEVDDRVKNKTGLIVATSEGHLKVVTTLLEFKASVDAKDEDGETALHYCAHLNQEEIARELMRHDADPNCVNDVGVFPLVIATAFGNYGMLRVLIESQKLNLRSQDLEGNTALHVAVLAHRSEAVRMLMEAGADPTIANHGSFTPILEAAKNGFYAGLEQFMKKCPREVNSKKEDDGHTALHIAAANDHLDIVCLLAAVDGCDLNAQNSANQTPLHLAARQGYTRIIEHLIDYGADPNLANMLGTTPLDVVITYRGSIKPPCEHCPQTLEINAELQSRSGEPPLESYVAVACLLVRQGAATSVDTLQAAGCPPDVSKQIHSYEKRGSYRGSLQHPSPHSPP